MMKRSCRPTWSLCLLLGALVVLGPGCGGDGLWSSGEIPTEPVVPQQRTDRADEDFEQGANWTGVLARPDLWTLMTDPNRPAGDTQVLTNADAEAQPHVALWDDVQVTGNSGLGISVLAMSDGARWMGVVLNYQADGTHYVFRVQPVSSLWEIQRVGRGGGTQTLAGGIAEDEYGKLLPPAEYIRLRLRWSPFQDRVLQASIVSPSTGVYDLASVTVSAPLTAGRAGLYTMGEGAVFDDVRMDGPVRWKARPSITVHAGSVAGTLHRAVNGVNIIWRGGTNGIGRQIYDELGYRAAVADWFGLLDTVYPIGLGATRYPGGLEALSYFWKHGVGPVSSRGNPNDSDTITLGTDEFLQFTEELGAEAVITLSPAFFAYPVGDPAVAQYAADWVEYCNAPNDGSNPGGGVDFAALRAFHGHEAPYNVKFWEVGNEIGGLNTVEFAAILNSFSAAIRPIDPTVELGFQDHVFSEPYNQDPFGPAAGDFYSNTEGTGILDLAGGAFDFWEPHPYGPSIVEIGPALFLNGGALTVQHRFDSAGVYRFLLHGFCSNPAAEPIRGHRFGTIRVTVDGETVWNFEASSTSERDWTQEVLISSPGVHEIVIQGDNLSNDRLIYLSSLFPVTNVSTGETETIDLGSSEEVYGVMEATAPYVNYVYYGLFQPFYGGKPIYPTEWNTTLGFYAAPNDLKWALSNADYLNVFQRNGTRLTNFWDLGSAQLLVGLVEGIPEMEPVPRLRPTAYVFQLYQDLLHEERVEVDTESPFYLRGFDGVRLGVVGNLVNMRIPYLSALASISADRKELTLIVINKHRDNAIQADVGLEDFVPSPSATISVIQADSIDADNEPDSCPDPGDCVRTVTVPWASARSSFAYTFPAHSITAFSFRRPGTDVQPPAAPANLTAEADGRTVQLAWGPGGGGVSGYNVYRSRWSQGPYGNRLNEAPVQATEYLDPDRDTTVTFYYTVTALDARGNESPFSNRAAVRIDGTLPSTYHPLEVTPLAGTADGDVQALERADYSILATPEGSNLLRIHSAGGAADWVMHLQVAEDPDSVSAFAVYFQAFYSVTGQQGISIWNVATSTWDTVRAVSAQADLINRYMEAFTDPTFVRNHIAEDGTMLVRITAALGGDFTCYADYCGVAVR